MTQVMVTQELLSNVLRITIPVGEEKRFILMIFITSAKRVWPNYISDDLNKAAFRRAFRNAIEEACRFAERKLGRRLSRCVIVKMYGAGVGGSHVTVDDFIDRAFISQTLFYRLIDVMVVEVIGTRPVVFARISDHTPDKLSKTWNGVAGPFHQLEAITIAQK